MLRTIHKSSKDLSREQVSRLILLQDKVWPKEEDIAKPMEERIDSYLSDRDEVYEIFLLEDDEDLMAHAEVFSRTIKTPDGNLEVMALASVCSPPDRRGEGFGKQIVLEAFKLVDSGRYQLSLFQTRVPEFYEKLGARRIENSFINSKVKDGIDKEPWWNPYRMIYPLSFTRWPNGEIDLLGPGY